MKSVILRTKDLCIGYYKGKNKHIVHNNLNLEILQGELTCLLGANGSGKSTLLRTLSAAQPAISGTIHLNGYDLCKTNKREISKNIGIVLTDKTQNGGLTVYETVALGRQPHTGFFGRLRKNDISIIDRTIDSIGISHKKESYMAELSDGEKQKVMIAKALVQECPLILLDEPTAFLDAISKIEIFSLLHNIAVNENKAIILSTHDIEQALNMADKLWLLKKDTGISTGVPEDIIMRGGMNDLFNTNNNIEFDQTRCTYTPNVTYSKWIILKSDDSSMKRLCENALKRYRIGCLGYNYVSGPYDLPMVELKSHNYFIIECASNKKLICHSFEELIENLI